MDFRLTEEQEKRRKEFFDVCKELEKKKPEGIYTLLMPSRLILRKA